MATHSHPPQHLPSNMQALILCGPGGSLSTFTSVPGEHPKALIGVGNRPVVWYVLDWVYRMGIGNITLITPPESHSALSAALAQNPHLTSLPSPSPTLLAPESLTHETATAELLRLPEVQACIVSDFLLLPCDLICSLPGDMFLETWMGSQGGFGGSSDGVDEVKRAGSVVGQTGRQRGGLSVWYSTVDREESQKGEECDFCATAKLDQDHEIPLSRNQPDSRSSRGILRKLLWAMPMSTLRDECEENKDHLWHVRSSLLAKYGSVKCLTRFRDAHIYLFPYWVKDFARLNDDFESVGEDLVGTWAKMDWRKPSYRARFHAKEVFKRVRRNSSPVEQEEVPIEEEIDLMSLSSTKVSRHQKPVVDVKSPITLASRVSLGADEKPLAPDEETENESGPTFPPMLAYIHSSDSSSPLIRRIDSTPLLLSTSLLLAKLPGLDEFLGDKKHSSPFSHPSKISSRATIAPRTTISRSDVLIGDNAVVSEKCVIKESVIGSAASVGIASRLTRCLIMDGATLGERCTLTDCVVGKKAIVGKNSTLQKCEVQDANVVPEKTEGKDEKYLVGGLEDEVDGDEALSYDDNDDKGS